MKSRLPAVLLAAILLCAGVAAPSSAEAPLVGEMDLQFNLGWPGYQEEIPDWVGTVTIEGDEYGMAFFLLGTGKPFGDDHLTGNASFFGEKWEIYADLEFEFDEDGVLTVFEPGATVLWGYDRGLVSLKNDKYRMNGSVEEAAEPFASRLGSNVHMGGTIVWYESGWPQYAPGTLHVN
jgi:hypothetical protein